MDERVEIQSVGLVKMMSHTEIDEHFFIQKNNSASVAAAVGSIIDDVRVHGDSAIRTYAARFDKANPRFFEIPRRELAAVEEVFKKNHAELYYSLCYARDLCYNFAQKQRECFTDFEVSLAAGMLTGQKTIPVERAGVYVPGGRFPLLSSVIMGVMPAKASGVKEVIVCTPPRIKPGEPPVENGNVFRTGSLLAEAARILQNGRQPRAQGDGFRNTGDVGSGLPWADEGILAVASLCGVDRIFSCGGAQSIAAMAYGTESIPRCDVIVGPGNTYVAEAKRLVYGQVGIDMIAGPTEVLIIADETAHAAWVAADMLAQAEHDTEAQAVLVTTSQELAHRVLAELDRQLRTLSTRETAEQSLKNNGYIIITETIEQAAEIANKKAPEHLELALDAGAKRARLEGLVVNYGSLFIGHEAAEVLGDYSAGLNHTLPTSGSARFTGGLSVRHFLKTVTTLRSDPAYSMQNEDTMSDSAKAAHIIAKAEGLDAHAAAAHARLV